MPSLREGVRCIDQHLFELMPLIYNRFLRERAAFIFISFKEKIVGGKVFSSEIHIFV